MAPPVLRTPGGDIIPLLAFAPLSGFTAGQSGQQNVSLLTDDTVTFSITTTGILDVAIGHTLELYGQLYTINVSPVLTREGEHRFEYAFSLEGPQYHLLRVIFFDTDTNGNALSSTFALTGNLSFFVTVLMANMARVFSGAWGLGTVLASGIPQPDGQPGTPIDAALTDTKTLTFEGENCLGVLQRLCSEFNTEFSIDYRPNEAPNRILNIGPTGTVLTDTFRYGQGNLMYTLSRKPVPQKPFYTRVYVFGAEKNLPAGYRGFASRLQLPLPAGPPPTQYSPWDSYVEDVNANVTYGLIEGVVNFDEIYPHRTGVVGSVVYATAFVDDLGFNPFEVASYDTTGGYPKPIYRYVLPGLTPKVSVLTGKLAGYTFELLDYSTATHIVKIRPFKDERGLEFPSPGSASAFSFQTGDTYTLIDIKMPDSYVTAAESKLLAAGQAYLAENSAPALEYELEIDERYLKVKATDTGPIPITTPPNFFAAGDYIRLVDTDFGVDQYLRVLGFSRSITRPYQYSLTVGAAPRKSLLQAILRNQGDLKAVIKSMPAPGNAPSTGIVKELIDTAITPVAGSVRHTLFAGVVPTGFRSILNGDFLRYMLTVGVSQKPPTDPNTGTTNPLDPARMIGMVRAVAQKAL